MRVLVRNRKRKLGGGPPVDQWRCKAVVMHMRNTDAGTEQAKVRWLTHGPGLRDDPGKMSRWLGVDTDLRRDESLTAIAHVEGIQTIMARQQERAGDSHAEVHQVSCSRALFFCVSPVAGFLGFRFFSFLLCSLSMINAFIFDAINLGPRLIGDRYRNPA
jgi:hypothetical protein